MGDPKIDQLDPGVRYVLIQEHDVLGLKKGQMTQSEVSERRTVSTCVVLTEQLDSRVDATSRAFS